METETTFESLGVEPQLTKALREEGYVTPTPVQAESIPVALEGRDLIGSAQTGTGKTAAFMLPILQRLRSGRAGVLRALILTPTRELAEQVHESARAYGRHTRLRSVPVYGGVSKRMQTDAIRKGVDIVVATPGRLLDHMGDGMIDLSNIEVLVLDEADRMLDMGFAPDVNKIIAAVPAERQTMLFSATISMDVDNLARRAMQDHAAVEIGHRATAAEGVEHMLVAVDKNAKRDALRYMLDQRNGNGRTLVFTRTKWGADKLAKHLRSEGRDVIALHSGKTQGKRNQAMDRFRNGQVQILVATDIAARGIDVDDIAMVVNYDVPNDPEAYVHRVGRTARAGATGLALTLMSPDEWLKMREVEKLMRVDLRRETLPGLEPAIEPVQPEDRPSRQSRPRGRSVRGRRGVAGRRR